jgi:ribosome-binding protein aMBF1 (putative translation factor)
MIQKARLEKKISQVDLAKQINETQSNDEL